MQTPTSSVPAEKPGMGSSVTPVRFRTRRRYIFFIVLCIAVVYGRTLNFDFVTYDDYELVVQNGEFLSNPAHVMNAFTTHAFTTHRLASGYYRPLLLVSYIADYQIWGLNPIGYHLTNIIIHTLATVVLFLLLDLFLANAMLSLFGALLFALHPVQTESVAWIAGRNDLLLGLFVLVMIYSYFRSLSGDENKYRAIAIASFGAALFTKESAAFYLLLLPCVELAQSRNGARALRFNQMFLRAMPFLLVLGCYLLIRSSVIGAVIGAERLYGVTPLLQRLTNIPFIISEHLKFICYPTGYSVVHPFEGLLWLHQPWTIVAWIIVLAFTGGIWWSASKRQPAFFGLGWLGIGLLPLLGLIPLAVPILEHRLYLPMAGVSFALTAIPSLRSWSMDARKFLCCATPLIAALAIASMLRLPVWQNSETLWRDAIEKSPESSRSYFNLAGYYFEHQEYEKTIRLMKTYVALKPDDALGYVKLGQTLQIAGRNDEASQVRLALIDCYRRNGDSLRAAELSRMPEPGKR